MKRYILYYLLDENRTPFYVGITTNLKTRLRRHKWEACYENKYYNLPKSRKLRKVLEVSGLKMRDLVDVIDSDVEEKDIDCIEQQHISKLRHQGLRIKNATVGGRDAHAHDVKLQKKAARKRTSLKRSEETKRRISLASKGIKKSEEHKQALSEAWKTRPKFSKKTLKKMKESMLGKNTSKYKLTDPNGKVYIVDGIVRFCQEHGLTHENICKVAAGQRLHHKGWKAEKLLTFE